MTAIIAPDQSPGAFAAVKPARSGWFLRLAGGLLAFCGVASLLAALGSSELLQLNDPVFNLPTRRVLLIFGLLELAMALVCLFSRRRNLSRWLLLWLAINLAGYRIGAGSQGWPHAYSYLGQLMHSLNLSPLRADRLMAALLAFWIGGSLVTLWQERRRAQAERFRKMSCPACGRHIRFAIESLGQKIPCPKCQTSITLHNPQPATAKPVEISRRHEVLARTLKISCTACGGHIEFPTNFFGERIPCPHCQTVILLQKARTLKMTCAGCEGHVEFPDHALGQTIPCPHCNQDITLKEPA